MVLLGTFVAVGKQTDKPLHGKNGRGEQSRNGERQERVERVMRQHSGIEEAKKNHGCPPARISRPFSKP